MKPQTDTFGLGIKRASDRSNVLCGLLLFTVFPSCPDSGFLPQVASQAFNLSLAVAIPVGGPDAIDVPAALAEDFFAQAVAVARCGV